MNTNDPRDPMTSPKVSPAMSPWRLKLHEVIFEADTPAGKAFDVALLLAILLSVVTVSLESVASIDKEYHRLFLGLEWGLTLVFTIEYVLRLLCVQRPKRYATSFFGVVDLLAILPTYLSLILPGAQSLAAIRALRLLRAFRIFKLTRMLREASELRQALWDARGKIVVFVSTVLIVVTIAGPAMYLVDNLHFGDGPQPPSQFTSIPQAMYWAVVTMTTVGYGDVVPNTTLGKLLSAFLMMLGYSLIIVPTGFITAELVSMKRPVSTQACPHCMAEGHDANARHCKRCGGRL